jgi:hypothetical protein
MAKIPLRCFSSTQRLLLFASIAASSLLSGCGDSTAVSAVELKEGDIAFQTSKSSQSTAIQQATHSPYTHVGILFNQNDRWCVLEAVGPVKYTPLKNWLANGIGTHYTIKRLKDSQALTQQSLEKLRLEGDRLVGKPYDPYFGWSDDKLYCSELVWKVYKKAAGIEVGVPRTLGEFDLTPPKVKAKLAERYGNSVPLNERVVAPSTIFDSPELATVCSR